MMICGHASIWRPRVIITTPLPRDEMGEMSIDLDANLCTDFAVEVSEASVLGVWG